MKQILLLGIILLFILLYLIRVIFLPFYRVFNNLLLLFLVICSSGQVIASLASIFIAIFGFRLPPKVLERFL